MSHYQKLKAMKTGFSSDFRTAIYADSFSHYSSISGIPPLILTNSKGMPLKKWSITGNLIQVGTPAPDTPVSVMGVGDYDAETGMYKVPVVCGNNTTAICLSSPLMDGETLESNGNKEVRWRKRILTGTESWALSASGTSVFYVQNVDGSKVSLLNNKAFSNIYSNHQTGNTEMRNYTIKQNVISNVTYLFIKDDRYGTVADFKAFLAEQYAKGTPVTVWYLLENPITETVSVPQIITVKGRCVIDAGAEVKAKNMSVTYKKRGR